VLNLSHIQTLKRERVEVGPNELRSLKIPLSYQPRLAQLFCDNCWSYSVALKWEPLRLQSRAERQQVAQSFFEPSRFCHFFHFTSVERGQQLNIRRSPLTMPSGWK